MDEGRSSLRNLPKQTASPFILEVQNTVNPTASQMVNGLNLNNVFLIILSTQSALQ